MGRCEENGAARGLVGPDVQQARRIGGMAKRRNSEMMRPNRDNAAEQPEMMRSGLRDNPAAQQSNAGAQ
jgi:hypothetical protein